MKTIFLLFASMLLAAELPFLPNSPEREAKIAIQNTILSRVNGKTISMLDVKKKMDLLFHQSYPQLADSSQARLQFYEASWRHILRDMVDNELILADADNKEIKVTDGEVREVLEARFGPNVMQTLDKIGLSYDESWKMVKEELIVQRMTWWFIHAKALASVTPQDIRQSYRLYLEKNPAYSEWEYRVISIRASEPQPQLLKQISETLSTLGRPPETEDLKQWESPGVTITVSPSFQAKTEDLSETHRTALTPLSPGTYSEWFQQTSRADQKTVSRTLYLIGKTEHPAPSFEELSQKLKNDLTQQAVMQESQVYLNKLRKHYGLEGENALAEDLHPFSLH